MKYLPCGWCAVRGCEGPPMAQPRALPGKVLCVQEERLGEGGEVQGGGGGHHRGGAGEQGGEVGGGQGAMGLLSSLLDGNCYC